MKLFKTLIAGLLLTVSATAMAQATYTDAQNNKYEFQKHWFLNLQGGAQYTLGEAKFKDLISPNVQLGLGYQFSPVFGMRLQANAWQSKGGWNGYETARNGNPYTNDYKFKYVAPGLDFMFNLSNLFCGWNPNRVFNVTAFLGGGANIAFDNDEVNDIAKTLQNLDAYELEYLWDGTKVRPFGRGGIDLGFRLSDAVQLVVEGNANILSDHYNSKKAGNADWYFNALAGVKVRLGKLAPKAAAAEPVVVEKIVEKIVEKPVEKIVYKEPEAPKRETLRRDIFFTLRGSQVSRTEMAKVEDVVAYMNKYPESKVSVTGYADKGTGNPRLNVGYAQKRADVITNMLVNQFGISRSRIISDSKGDTVQPYEQNDLNRVTICICE